MGAGFVATSLLGSLAGQPAAAYQATFNLQVPNVANQPTRTFIDGPPSDHTMVMTATSQGTRLTTSATLGLCNIGLTCGVGGSQTVGTFFSFSKPTKGFSFKVGSNQAPSGGWNNGGVTSYLTLNINSVDVASIPLVDLPAGNTIYSFTPSILVAANTAISVGFSCVPEETCTNGGGQFWISDVIVEVPAPLPLIGTGAAFAWTRRLRRRIKATPSPIGNS
jgi:hypothetical protein